MPITTDSDRPVAGNTFKWRLGLALQVFLHSFCSYSRNCIRQGSYWARISSVAFHRTFVFALGDRILGDIVIKRRSVFATTVAQASVGLLECARIAQSFL